MSVVRDQAVSAAEAILEADRSGSDVLHGVLVEMVERLLGHVKKPWLSECDRHVDATFQCLSCSREDLETIRDHVVELRAVHRNIKVVVHGLAKETGVCVRCRELWPCETMAAVEGAAKAIGQHFRREPTS